MIHEQVTFPPSDSPTSDQSQIFVTCRIENPSVNYPVPTDLAPVHRPLTVHRRPKPPGDSDDGEPENPKILAMERKAARLKRWIVTCHLDSPVAVALEAFLNGYHRGLISGWDSESNRGGFQHVFRSHEDVITGFHFVGGKEHIFVLESRMDEKKNASKKLEDFLKQFPPTVHILADEAETFRAPRLYCCFDRLIKTIRIPISLQDLLKVGGLYVRSKENHKLFKVSQKLVTILRSRCLSEVVISEAFPSYREMKLLEKKARGLYAMPLFDGYPVLDLEVVENADFGECENYHTGREGDFDLVEEPSVCVERGTQRITNYILTMPPICVHSNTGYRSGVRLAGNSKNSIGRPVGVQSARVKVKISD
jgi:hypothetical protein